MKKIAKILGIFLLAFVVIVVYVIVKDIIDENKKSNEPPITNNGGGSGESNSNENKDDDNSDKNNEEEKPTEPEKVKYTNYEPVNELIDKFNVIEVDSFCIEGFQEGSNEYCLNTPLVVSICWFGGGSEVRTALVETLNMVINHPEFEQLNKEKKISLSIDVTYVKSLHSNTTYSFDFFVFQHKTNPLPLASFTGRVARREEVTVDVSKINAVYELYHKYY